MPGVLVPTVGVQWIVDRLDGTTTTATVNTISHVGVGTGSTDPVAGNTALGTEVETRGAATLSQQTTTLTGDTLQSVGTVTATAPRVIAEAGAFTASSGGTMPIRGTFAAINLATSDTITPTLKIAIAAV